MTPTPPAWGRRDGAPLVIAHRGASAIAVENTLAAFAAAAVAGADGVELDVRQCATGEVVVFHDADLKRLAGRPQRIDRLPLAALREVRLRGAPGEPGAASPGEPVPTLDEVFEALPAPLLVNVEIKADRALEAARLPAAVVACVRRHHAEARVLVSSFNPVALARLRAAAGDLAIALLFHGKLALPLRRGWAARALRPLAVHPQHELVTAESMRQWRRHRWAVNVWTVDDEAEVRRLVGLGVDGIVGNDPAANRRYVKAALAAR